MEFEALVEETLALIAEGDRCSEKGAEFYRQAGQRLRMLKDARPRSVPWESFVMSMIGISRERADELIRIAEGRTTVEAVQAGNRQRQARHRQKQVLRHTGIGWPFLFTDKVTLATQMLRHASLPELPHQGNIEVIDELISVALSRRAELVAAITPPSITPLLSAPERQPEAQLVPV